MITIDSTHILLIAVYMSRDEQIEGENLNEFNEVLNAIQSVCLSCETQYIIVSGDFN